MIEIKGKYNTATIYAKTIEEKCVSQIYQICRQKIFEDVDIRIMPDTHLGKGSVVGFTCTEMPVIVPSIIGSDIGCGIEVVKLGNIDIDLYELNKFILENIPHGVRINKQINKYVEKDWKRKLEPLVEKIGYNMKMALCALGSLGGGNHFIEIDVDTNNNKYLIIHSGSRKLGNDTAQFYQRKAEKYCKQKRLVDKDKESIYYVEKELSFLEDELAEDYLSDMLLVQKYAEKNRKIMARRIVEFLGKDYTQLETFTVIHNYYNFSDGIIRKGAISAYDGEEVLIPLNMKDGCILGIGKSTREWNYSAPHGAGRILSRNKAKRELSLEEFQESMKKVFSTSVKQTTLDESPMAYKKLEDIISFISECIEIKEIIKPIYNFKA